MKKNSINIKAIIFENGILVDIPLILIAFFINRRYVVTSFLVGRDDLKDLTNSLVGTLTSISGFSLAALTIIITIRSNVVSKQTEKSENALEALFKTPAYFRITRIFKHIIIEQAFTAIMLILTWTFFKITSSTHAFILLIGCYILLVSVVRLFYILFMILGSEKIKRQERPKDIPQAKY